MLGTSAGSTATLCPTMAAAWSSSSHDYSAMQQPIAFQHIAAGAQSAALPSHHASATAPATYHHVSSNPGAQPEFALPQFSAQYGGQQQQQHLQQVQQPQQHQQQLQRNDPRSTVQETMTSTSNHWANPTQVTQPSSACVPANLPHVSVYRPMAATSAAAAAAAAAAPQRHHQQATMLSVPAAANTTASPQHGIATVTPSQNPAAAVPLMVMPVSVSNQNLPYHHHHHHHQHHQQHQLRANLASQEHGMSAPTVPQRPFFHGLPAMNIQQPSPASLLFHEPITQKQRTQPLRDWIVAHRSHPYPTRDEKLALAMLTHMRVDQVTMWFANTRRQIRRIGMKAWSGGLFDSALPYRIGNGAIIPAGSSQSDASNDDEDSNTSASLADSSSQVPTDSSGSLD